MLVSNITVQFQWFNVEKFCSCLVSLNIFKLVVNIAFENLVMLVNQFIAFSFPSPNHVRINIHLI